MSVVLKFGGSSVTGLESWRRILDILSPMEGQRPVVVCSAISGVSDQLEALLAVAAAGGDCAPLLDALEARHARQAEELGLVLVDEVGELLSSLRRLAQGAALIGEVSPRLRARVLSAGELLSTRLGAAWLERQGLVVHWQDA